MSAPSFLDLPHRSPKPRTAGVTHVLDQGLGRAQTELVLAPLCRYVDVWKLGWGTAYVQDDVAAKVALLVAHDTRACTGGTLLEVAWAQGRAEACLDWAEAAGFDCVEVSDGAVEMPGAEKRRLIARAASRFCVLSEVGSKDPAVVRPPTEWAEAARADLDAGASWVITEGRASGTTGIYRPDGSVRADVVEATADAVGLDRLIFEAPRLCQQVWLVRRFGPDVGLGNVAHAEVLALEALRLGLRADTVDLAARSVPEGGSPA
ncbi:MAG: phosphosulfolactate synthase [Acidimicrobiales bacterium]